MSILVHKISKKQALNRVNLEPKKALLTESAVSAAIVLMLLGLFTLALKEVLEPPTSDKLSQQ